MVHPAYCHSHSDGPGFGGADRVSSALVNVVATGTADGADEQSLARDMLDVHGPKAAVVARDNARAAALAGQRPQAKFWIRVLGIIQQRGTV
jgi:hypothetical protein